MISSESGRRVRKIVVAGVMCAVLYGGIVAHAQSALDGFDPGANGTVLAFVVQPNGKILVSGEFTQLGGGGTGTTPRNHIGRLNADGSLDAGFDPGATGRVWTMVPQPDGKILVGGTFTGLGGGSGTTPRNNIGRLNADGSVDPSFNPGTSGIIGVFAMAVQADGKILVGGAFTGLGGGTGATPRSSLGRLNADGSVDTSFNPGVSGQAGFYEGQIFALAVQPDGKIVVGGRFTGLGGGTGATPRANIGRLNADGSVDASFDPGVNNFVFAVAVQPDGKIVLGGSFLMMGGGGTGTASRIEIGRLKADGSLDTSFNPGTNGGNVLVLALQPDGKIIVGGNFTGLGGGTGTTPRNRIGQLNSDGSLDLTFNPGTSTASLDGVRALSSQPDGKLLVGGTFTGLGGGTGTTLRNKIGRLYADGSLDADLNPGASGIVYTLAVQLDGKILFGGATFGNPNNHTLGRLDAGGSLDTTFNLSTNGPVYALALQPDGNIVVGGAFTQFRDFAGGTLDFRNNIGRFFADGGLDFAFNPGADGKVNAVAVQPDGKILVGGSFSTLGGQEEYNLGRLNSDGSVDTSFTVWTNGEVWAIALQPDGKIVVGGAFTTIQDENAGIRLTRIRICRLNADGSPDVAFDPGADSNAVRSLAIQADGKILVGGSFSALGGGTGTTLRNYIGRILGDGSVDPGFNPGANSEVWAFAVQTDGKIVIGGAFTRLGGGSFNGPFRQHIGAVAADGSLDPTFDPGAQNVVRAFALQSDGKIVVGGSFSMLGGGGIGTTPRQFIGRLTNTGAAFQHLGFTSGVVTWSRGGAGPEVSRVTFESKSSAEGATYASLGIGTRVAGGWQLTGQSLPINQSLFIRARGYYATGYGNGSSSIVESIRNVYVSAPTISSIANTTTRRNTPLMVSFSVANSLASTTAVVVSGGSLNPTLVPNANLVFGGSGSSRTLTITPASNQTGNTRITIAANDGGLSVSTSLVLVVYASMRADVNRDGKADVLLRNKSTGQNIGWLMDGTTVTSSALLPTIADTNWEIKGVGDFDADGTADVIWRHKANGQNIAWLMNGLTVASSAFLPTIADTNWEIVGVGDFDGDGKADVILRNKATGQDIAWLMNGAAVAFSAFLPTIADTNWEIKGVADFDGDGRADVILRNKATGQDIVWLMNGASVAFSAFLPTIADLNWEIVGVGDLDGDGKADVVLRNKVTGQNIGWLMNGAAVGLSGFLTTIADANWEIQSVSDLNGEGHADVVWRNKVTGQNIAWLMNGLSIASSAFLPTIADVNWEIITP